MDLSRWWITDLAAATDELAAATLKRNCTYMAALGAHVGRAQDGSAGAIVDVTGFTLEDDTEGRERGLREPIDILPKGHMLAGVIWGSPHGHASDLKSSSRHGPWASSNADFKTKAFEAMAYVCQGLVIMSLPSKYKIEFWPRIRQSDRRSLLQCRVRYLAHKSSVTGHAVPIDETYEEAIAMLLPPGYVDLANRHTDRATNTLNYAAFIRNVYADSGATEHFVELGCNTASLSMELVLQWQLEQFGAYVPGKIII